MIEQQILREREREGTWYSGVKEVIVKYGIVSEVTALKSVWKKEVKEKIRQKTEEYVREECRKQKKARNIKEDKYEAKPYLIETTCTSAKEIMEVRLNMVKLPCNYKGINYNGKCVLCGETEEIAEHYLQCSETEYIRERCNVTQSDMNNMNITCELKRMSQFMKLVVILVSCKSKDNIIV